MPNENITNPKPLAGQVALVTGGTRGIGRAIAKMLLEEGAAVAICGRRQEDVDDAVRALEKQTGGKVNGKAADVRDHGQVSDLFRSIDAGFGRLDVVVNNAGVGVFGHARDLTWEQWRD